ncbi:Flocculation protein FLO11 [Rhizoctonia solani]|uniref:Flocculation protein FLO11 n=1 Tax=Rhizoctonia solani TaxID=456999 RepID=A0A0K6G9A2_9AGAM|nr:Flocculation protein FLO11 [Rhizoctonia solani]
MAGWWNFEAQDLHVEYMEIDGIVGLFQETDHVWRYGKEPILWAHSKKGFAYALQHPHESYVGEWESTVESWSANHGNVSPAFQELTVPYEKPSWWPAGQDFDRLRQYIRDRIARATATSSTAKSKKISSRSKNQVRRRGQGKKKTRRKGSKITPPSNIDYAGESKRAESEEAIDSEGETDHESEPVGSANCLVGTQIPATEETGTGSGEGRGESKRYKEGRSQLEEGAGVGTEEEKGDVEMVGGEVSRPNRMAKTNALDAISAPYSCATKRKRGDMVQDTIRRDGQGDFNPTPSDSRAIPKGPESRLLQLPRSIGQVNWKECRISAVQTARDHSTKAIEKQPSNKRSTTNTSTGNQPVEIQSSPGETVNTQSFGNPTRVEEDVGAIGAVSSTEPFNSQSHTASRPNTPPITPAMEDVRYPQRPPATPSQSDECAQTVFGSAPSTGGGYDGDASKSSQENPSVSAGGPGSQSITSNVPDVGPGTRASNTAGRTAATRNKLYEQIASMRKVRGALDQNFFASPFSREDNALPPHLRDISSDSMSVIPTQHIRSAPTPVATIAVAAALPSALPVLRPLPLLPEAFAVAKAPRPPVPCILEGSATSVVPSMGTVPSGTNLPLGFAVASSPLTNPSVLSHLMQQTDFEGQPRPQPQHRNARGRNLHPPS